MSPEANTIVIVVFGIVLEACFVSWLLNKYSNPRKTQWYVSVLVWFGWYLSFAIVFFIPMDVTSARHDDRCHVPVPPPPPSNTNTTQPTNSTVTNSTQTPIFQQEQPVQEIPGCETTFDIENSAATAIWKTLYWSTYLLCWAVYPVMQSYVLAAHFTFYERFIRALKENLILYAVMGLAGVVIIIYVVSTGKLQADELPAVAMILGNTYGQLLLFMLLSYGLIEVPKNLWHKRSRQLILKSFQFQVVGLLKEVTDARDELEVTLRLVKKYDDSIAQGEPFRPFIDTIVKKCPVEYSDLICGEGSFELQYDKVVALHARVINATMQYSRSRCLYEQLLLRIYTIEDKMKSITDREKKMTWSFPTRKWNYPHPFFYKLEWIFYKYIECNLWIVAAGLAALLSVSIVWSESVFWIAQKWDYHFSVFYWLLEASYDSDVLIQWIMIFIPGLYIAFTAYWSLFQLRLFNYFRLLPHQQSDANSILFSAYYICRLSAPMVYNLLLMLGDKRSNFYKYMGEMNFDSNISVTAMLPQFLPLVLIVLCAFNVFNVYSWILGFCCFRRFQRFVYDEEYSDDRIIQGKDIAANERRLKEAGRGLSIDQNNNFSKTKKKGFFSTETFSIFKSKKKEADTVELLEDNRRIRRELV